MGATTTSLGGGTGDAANQTLTLSAGEDVISNVSLPSTSTYISGGFDSLGNQYTTRPIAISDVTVVLGKSGGANVGVRAMFKTSITGNPAVNSTNTYYTGLLPAGTDFLATTQTSYLYDTFVSGPAYYGFEGVGASGPIEYGSGGSSGFIYEGSTKISSTTKISGSITQVSIPSAPSNLNALSITDTTANVTWSAPTDDGMQSPAAYSAANINGYRINYRNSDSENWKVLVANTGSNALFRVVTGLSPSTYYEIQVAALNDVTDAHNSGYTSITAHVGSRSTTHTFNTTASTHDIRIWDGSGYKKGIVKVWDGAAWLEYPDITIKVWNGTAFEDVTLET